LKALAQLPVIRMEAELEALSAIDAAEKDGADLADMLIAALRRKAGCAVTLTLNEDAARLPGFEPAR
jgi:predicted nucleic acid-binding protein